MVGDVKKYCTAAVLDTSSLYYHGLDIKTPGRFEKQKGFQMEVVVPRTGDVERAAGGSAGSRESAHDTK